jgi:hypothetical protein
MAIITKWDASGNITWQKSLIKTGGFSVFYNAVAIDSSNNIYAVGNDTNNNKAIITKWDTAGNVVWQNNIGSGNDYFYGVACDSSGNIYAVGMTGSSGDGFITKWNSSGTLTWQRTLGTTSYQEGFNAVACDSSGNIYAIGYEAGSTSGNNDEAFITKWDSSGNLTWQNKITNNSTGYIDRFNGVTVDSSGNIYVSGYVNISGRAAPYVTKWSASGALTWQRDLYDSTSGAQYTAVTCDPSGNVYPVGYMSGSECLISKWISDPSSVPNGSLVGTGLTNLAVQTPTYSVTSPALTVATPTLATAAAGLTAGNPGLSASTTTLTRNYSSF